MRMAVWKERSFGRIAALPVRGNFLCTGVGPVNTSEAAQLWDLEEECSGEMWPWGTGDFPLVPVCSHLLQWHKYSWGPLEEGKFHLSCLQWGSQQRVWTGWSSKLLSNPSRSVRTLLPNLGSKLQQCTAGIRPVCCRIRNKMKIVSFKEKESRFLITLTSSAFLVAETDVQI